MTSGTAVRHMLPLDHCDLRNTALQRITKSWLTYVRACGPSERVSTEGWRRWRRPGLSATCWSCQSGTRIPRRRCRSRQTAGVSRPRYLQFTEHSTHYCTVALHSQHSTINFLSFSSDVNPCPCHCPCKSSPCPWPCPCPCWSSPWQVLFLNLACNTHSTVLIVIYLFSIIDFTVMVWNFTLSSLLLLDSDCRFSCNLQ